MLLNATRRQIHFLLRQKGAIATFCLLLALMLVNFTQNVLDFQGTDVLFMIHPMKLLTLSYNRVNYNQAVTLLLIQLVPLLVNLPAGLSLCFDRQTGEDKLLAARLGNRVYVYAKLLAVFCVTTLVFALPFLIEIALNCIAFPLNAEGDLAFGSVFSQQRIDFFGNYQFKRLYLFSPYLYAVVFTLLFGAVAGVLASFTAALSAVVRVKYRIFLILPDFLLLQGMDYISAYCHNTHSTPIFSWYDYLLFCHDMPRNAFVGPCVLAALLALTLLGAYLGGRRELLK